MTTKELLLKDLCARLNCGVEVYAQYEPTGEWYNGRLVGINLEDEPCFTVQFYKPVPYTNYCNKKEIKPYLRPMSSMTAEEEYEYHQYKNIDYLKICEMKHVEILKTTALCFSRATDWLNKKGFDYRGLIPMGLALEATEGMYK